MGKIMMNGIQYGVGGMTDASDVKYDDTDVASALDDLTTDIASLNTKIAWTSPSSASSLSDFTDWVDAKIDTNGFLMGYMTVGIASAVGLTGVGHVFQVMSNSQNYRCVIAYPMDNAYIAVITKQGGTWKTVWKKATLS